MLVCITAARPAPHSRCMCLLPEAALLEQLPSLALGQGGGDQDKLEQSGAPQALANYVGVNKEMLRDMTAVVRGELSGLHRKAFLH